MGKCRTFKDRTCAAIKAFYAPIGKIILIKMCSASITLAQKPPQSVVAIVNVGRYAGALDAFVLYAQYPVGCPVSGFTHRQSGLRSHLFYYIARHSGATNQKFSGHNTGHSHPNRPSAAPGGPFVSNVNRSCTCNASSSFSKSFVSTAESIFALIASANRGSLTIAEIIDAYHTVHLYLLNIQPKSTFVSKMTRLSDSAHISAPLTSLFLSLMLPQKGQPFPPERRNCSHTFRYVLQFRLPSAPQRYNILDFPGKVVYHKTAGFFWILPVKGELYPL